MGTDRLAEIQTKLAAYREHPVHQNGFACCTAHAVADEVPFLLGEITTRLAELSIAEGRNRDLAEQLAQRNRQLNGLIEVLGYDEKAVPA